MRAARAACWGFDLGADDGYAVLADHYNPRCEPPWLEPDLRRKCSEAMDANFAHPRGWLLNAEPDPPRRHPHRLPVVAAPASPAAPSPGPPALPTAPGGRIPHVRNFIIRPLENGGENRIGLTPQQIAGDILGVTSGWPKACNGRLFIPGPDHTPRWLDGATELFGWLAGHVGQGGGLVEWGRGEGHIPKSEFYEHLCGAVEQFEDVQTFPHHPRRPGTFYLHPELPSGGSGALDELLALLRPAADVDRHLIRSFFLSLAWGGKLGGRPIFIFESATTDGRPGQGAGKSTAAMLAGKLFGGYLGISLATADDMQMQTRLLSEHGRRSRLVVFDNLKGTRVSNSLIESYVTADVISGRELYVGEGTRPNIITWAITANQPSLSTDFTGRAYPIRISPPSYSPTWTAEVERLVRDCRWEIIGDIVAELQASPVALLADGEWSRWPEWECDVLCRVCDPRPLAGIIGDRRKDLDDDAATTQTVREAFVTYLNEKLIRDPELLHLIMPVSVLADALGKLCPHGASAVHVGRWLNSMSVRGLAKRRTEKARLWVWKGEQAEDGEPLEWETFVPMAHL